MAKTTKKETPVAVTRAEKKDAAKNIIREILAVKPLRHNELIDEAAKLYSQRFGGDNVNDVNGRIGSVLDIMKKESDVMYDGGMYALKARSVMPAPEKTEGTAEEKTEEKPVKKVARSRTKKTAENAAKTDEKTAVKEEVKIEEIVAETPVKKGRKTRAKKEKAEPLPAAPLQPIAPVAPITPESAPEPIPEKEDKKAESTAPKKRGRKPKATAEETTEKAAETELKTEAKPQEEKEELKTEIKNPPAVKEKAEIAEKNVVMDMSFLFGAKPQKAQEEKVEKAEKPMGKSAEKSMEIKLAKPKTDEKRPTRVLRAVKKAVERPLTADEKLRENFLKRLRSLGGDYFEYYSVYLLERYSMKNGRRLEGMKICGGERDGGIDGEIEVTDKLGFRETIYIQAKNWNPEKGDERLWVVGETLLQQFIGACACRQAKDGKQHCRGIFITTSRFTPDAKRILDDLSDKIVGYDGEDLFEAAKECKFGLLYENGNWKLDEKLLSGTKAFFNMY